MTTSGPLQTPPSDFMPLGTTPIAQSALTPPATQLIGSPASYLPHPFTTPFLPYDISPLRANNLRTLHQQSATMTIPNNADFITSSRLSPASSRNSTSSPPSSTPQQKINNSIELNSTNEHSSDESDEEQIDVVKSAFVPILRPPVAHIEITVKAENVEPKTRCELKAPSSKKLNTHETAPTGPKSPDTKLKSPVIKQERKTVWRPY